VRVVEPKAIRGTLTLSHFVIMDSEAGKGKYSNLATFYQVKPEDIKMLVARFREDNPTLDNVEIGSKFNYVLCDFHHSV
jgi:hypothetical protein